MLKYEGDGDDEKHFLRVLQQFYPEIRKTIIL